MYALASTLVTVLRGTTVNQYGDVVDDPATAQIIATGVPACIEVTSSRPYDPATQQIRVIQTITGSIQSDVDIRETDQLRDDESGALYAIESVTQKGGPGFIGDLDLVLKRIT